MKAFSVRLNASSDPESVAKSLRQKLDSFHLTADDLISLDRVNTCIREFIAKAQDHRASGTTVRINRHFVLASVELDVVLEDPESSNILKRWIRSLLGDI